MAESTSEKDFLQAIARVTAWHTMLWGMNLNGPAMMILRRGIITSRLRIKL